MSNADMSFAVYMRSLRTQSQLSVDEAALKLGVGIHTLEEWESGASLPSELSASRFSQVYKVSEQEWIQALRRERMKVTG